MKPNDETYFQNRQCPYFPCHQRANEDFNCLFCYCPLYALGEGCGGNFVYSESGLKDCSQCLLPHSSGGYDYVLSQYPKIAELAAKQPKKTVDK